MKWFKESFFKCKRNIREILFTLVQDKNNSLKMIYVYNKQQMWQTLKTKWFFYLPPVLRNTTIQNEATPPPFSFWIVDIRISIWLLPAPPFLWPPHLFKISSKFFSMHFRSEEMGKFYNYISHDTTSLSRHKQVCLSRLCFKRYFSHHWAT